MPRSISIYQILRLRLPMDATPDAPALSFDFVDNALTGHINGLITVNLGEADPVKRERQRQSFGEPHRTLVGHMRHESGHYFWMRLMGAFQPVARFRELFGNERQDYVRPLPAIIRTARRAVGASAWCPPTQISHPWEDWRELWARSSSA